MEAEQVVALLRTFRKRDLLAWVAGGWAVDAIVGHQSRAHADLDLAVDAAQLSAVFDVLAELGFGVTADSLPVRADLTALKAEHSTYIPLSSTLTGAASSVVSTTSLLLTPQMASLTAPLLVTWCRAYWSATSLDSGKATSSAFVDHHDMTLLRKWTSAIRR